MLLFFPEFRYEQNCQGVDLQPVRKHAEGENPLGQLGQIGVGQTGTLGPETGTHVADGDCHGGKGVAQGVECIHATAHEQREVDNGKYKLDDPERSCHLGHPWFQLVLAAGKLRLVELHAPQAEQGQNGNGTGR